MACSPPDTKGATRLGACRYPGHTNVRAHGTTVSSTSRPAQGALFYTKELALKKAGYHFHASWCPAGHAQLT
jgi:hypothetical protein